MPVKAAETASQLYQNMPAVPLIDKAALICCVEYMLRPKMPRAYLSRHLLGPKRAYGGFLDDFSLI